MDCEIWYRIITWLLVVLGWLVVWRVQENTRKKDKLQERANRLIHEAEELQLAAVDFYTMEGNAAGQDGRRVKIVAKLSWLGHAAALIVEKRRHCIFDRIGDFRRAITLTDFDSLARPACTASDYKIANIVEAAQALTAAIQESVDRTVKMDLRLKEN